MFVLGFCLREEGGTWWKMRGRGGFSILVEGNELFLQFFFHISSVFCVLFQLSLFVFLPSFSNENVGGR